MSDNSKNNDFELAISSKTFMAPDESINIEDDNSEASTKSIDSTKSSEDEPPMFPGKEHAKYKSSTFDARVTMYYDKEGEYPKHMSVRLWKESPKYEYQVRKIVNIPAERNNMVWTDLIMTIFLMLILSAGIAAVLFKFVF